MSILNRVLLFTLIFLFLNLNFSEIFTIIDFLACLEGPLGIFHLAARLTQKFFLQPHPVLNLFLHFIIAVQLFSSYYHSTLEYMCFSTPRNPFVISPQMGFSAFSHVFKKDFTLFSLRNDHLRDWQLIDELAPHFLVFFFLHFPTILKFVSVSLY